MRKILLLPIALSAFWPSAHASDFRFCDMAGTVQSVTLRPGDKGRVFDFAVLVSSAQPEKGERGKMGYTDCSEFVGEKIEIRLQLPKRFGQPGSGDHIAFNYSAVDGFDANGEFAGTFIDAKLHSYQGASSPAGR